jgi:group I intron endonuclease
LKFVVYKITNTISGKIYIGSTKNFLNRKTHHLVCLRNKKHRNQYLQKAFDKYGEDKFIFEILEENIEEQKLLLREQFYLDSYKSYNREIGYNLNPTAGSNKGFKMPESAKQILREKNLGKRHSDKTKDKISKIQIGKKRTYEAKLKTSKKCRWENNPAAKLNFEIVNLIRQKRKNGSKLKELCKEFNVSQSLISAICTYKIWKEGDYYVAD